MRKWILGWLCVLGLLVGWARAANQVAINFDNLTAASPYNQGLPIPANCRLSNQLLSADGVAFSSSAGYVAVVNLGSSATTPPNGIAGTAVGNTFNYAAPVTFSFWDPSNGTTPATTDFFSLRGDKDNNGGGGSITVSAFDINGNLLGSNTQLDTGGETWTLNFPGMHSVRFPGVPWDPGNGGIALDDVAFNAVTVVPEPATPVAMAFAIGVLAVARRGRRRRLFGL